VPVTAVGEVTGEPSWKRVEVAGVQGGTAAAAKATQAAAGLV